MNILAALKQEEAKLQKQADKVRQQLDAVRAARKILGREVASGGKRVGRKKRKMSAATKAKISKATKARWAKIRAEKKG
jgi:predicted  nucleic acid-binding Zn-ribbon protein